MNKAQLKKDMPDWKWTAKHYGMGWRYVGIKGKYKVCVQAEAVLCGPCEDDYATRWMVDDGKTRMSYSMWCLGFTI